MARPLVSLLIPAFNAEAFIGAAIDSGLAQSWRPLEIIVVDDGSTDSTLAVARQRASSSVLVVSQANAGASAARNKALSLAQGDYIQWLDADDLLDPSKIGLQMDAAAEAGDDRVLFSGAFGEFLTDPALARFRPTVLWKDLSPVECLLAKFNENVWIAQASWLVSRTLSDAAGPWDERLTLNDDGEYFCRVIAASTQLRFVPDAKMFYRRSNPRSLSHSVSDAACDSLLLSLQLSIDHLLALEASDRTRRASSTLLQTWIDRSTCFWPDEPGRLERVQAIARGLGTTLEPPRLNWKYAPIRLLLGWKAAKRASFAINSAKTLARLQLERLAVAVPKR